MISKTGLERFQAFVKAGGKLIFVGKTPTLVVDKTFLNAKEKPDLSFATLIEPSGDITERVIAALPKPDVALDSQWQRLTYNHRRWRDADMYFFFNESNQEQSRTATIAGRGQAQVWDLTTGEIHPISGATAEGDSVRFSLVLGPYETKVVVVGPLPSGVAAPEPSLVSGNTLADLGGDWMLDLNGKQLTTPLKSWEDLGATSFAGPATYRKQFTISAVPAGKRLFLEMADVHDYARVKAERERVGRPRVAAVSLGVDQCGEAGRERSGSGSACGGGRRARRLWSSASGCGCRARRRGCGRPRRQGRHGPNRAGSRGRASRCRGRCWRKGSRQCGACVFGPARSGSRGGTLKGRSCEESPG